MIPLVTCGSSGSLWFLWFPGLTHVPQIFYDSLWFLRCPGLTQVPQISYESLWFLRFPVVPVVPWVDSGLQVSFGSLCFCRFLWFPVVPFVPRFPPTSLSRQGQGCNDFYCGKSLYRIRQCLQSKDTQPMTGPMEWQM